MGVAPKEGWFIITNVETLESAAAYKRRFHIEEMFRDFKSGGYNLEDTNVSSERLMSLILLIAIAYTSATIQGQKIKRKGIQKYVGRVKEDGLQHSITTWHILIQHRHPILVTDHP